MRRVLFVSLLVLFGCIPTFEQADPEQLTLTRQGDTLTLRSDVDVVRGSVGVRAEAVTSHLCAVAACLPDLTGLVLLRLVEGPEYGRTVILGDATGLVRIKAAIVRVDEQRALEYLWEF